MVLWYYVLAHTYAHGLMLRGVVRLLRYTISDHGRPRLCYESLAARNKDSTGIIRVVQLETVRSSRLFRFSALPVAIRLP